MTFNNFTIMPAIILTITAITASNNDDGMSRTHNAAEELKKILKREW